MSKLCLDYEKQEFLSKITKPFTNVIIQIDKKIIQKIAEESKKTNSTKLAKLLKTSLVKVKCGDAKNKIVPTNVTTTYYNFANKTVNMNLTSLNGIAANNSGNYTITAFNNTQLVEKSISEKDNCSFLFYDTGLSDSAIGVIMLIISLFILCVCLVAIVKTLHSLLKGQIAIAIKKTFNSEFPKPFTFLTGYVAILVGAGLTILVQSSSIFTSALTPVVGLGIVSLDRIYPLTLGSNIGTTVTGILAALAASSNFTDSFQIALCHLFFNISGIILFYPVPFMRRLPIRAARTLGNTTAKYRWFAIFYLIFVFFVLPALIFALSLAGIIAFCVIMVPIALIIIFIIVVNVMQRKRPDILPQKLQTWEFLPIGLRSLEPYDKLIQNISAKCRRKKGEHDIEMS